MTDGVLEIEFASPRGHKPIVNAIFVTHAAGRQPRHLTGAARTCSGPAVTQGPTDSAAALPAHPGGALHMHPT